jgi:hypothetical protein
MVVGIGIAGCDPFPKETPSISRHKFLLATGRTLHFSGGRVKHLRPVLAPVADGGVGGGVAMTQLLGEHSEQSALWSTNTLRAFLKRSFARSRCASRCGCGVKLSFIFLSAKTNPRVASSNSWAKRFPTGHSMATRYDACCSRPVGRLEALGCLLLIEEAVVATAHGLTFPRAIGFRRRWLVMCRGCPIPTIILRDDLRPARSARLR